MIFFFHDNVLHVIFFLINNKISHQDFTLELPNSGSPLKHAQLQEELCPVAK